jgi:hypothetical protein
MSCAGTFNEDDLWWASRASLRLPDPLVFTDIEAYPGLEASLRG